MNSLVRRVATGAVFQRSVLGVFLLAVSVVLAPTVARTELGENPPRYHLKAGQKIEYRDLRQSDGEGKRKDTFGLTYWVVGENPDQSWRILFHHVSEHAWIDDKGAETTKASSDEFGYFDLFADGRIVTCQRWFSLSPELFFLRLPPEPLTAETTWESVSSDGATKWFFQAEPPAADAPTWLFTARKEYLHDKIFLTSGKLSQTFDLERGLVRSATSRLEQGWGIEQTVVGNRELVGNEQLPEAEARQLSREAAIYFRAIDDVQPLYNAAERDLRHTAELLDRVDAAFAGLAGQLQLPIFQSILDSERKLRSRARGWRIEAAELFARHVDRPSPEWKTTDLDGTPHALKDYRGKIVLLDFWYRGCGSCLRSMPQINQLADDFKDQPVVILGMNNDQDEADARFVVEAFKITHPTLKNRIGKDEGINTQYATDMFPSFILIDQQGVVRDFRVGDLPTLRDDLAARIRELLAAGEAPAAELPEPR
ncbi:MAG TPA: TlpA disulfide reductase family protein [Pirellulales bacterium]|jgi:thiol-disulfide isomerase/thioredoxin|nr:TlpA disulfide reductase family protein [Pirellulales bacterium]